MNNSQSPEGPYCSAFKNLRSPKLLEALQLDKKTFKPVFKELDAYWNSKLGDKYYGRYLLCAVKQLGDILDTPEDWLDAGKYLADATSVTFGNGSHDFIEEAVPALIEGGLAANKEELYAGVEVLLDVVNATSACNGRQFRNGGHTFPEIGKRIRAGELNSLEDIQASYPTQWLGTITVLHTDRL